MVSPSGAPYCYVVPPGFTRTKATLGGADYASAVSLDNHDIIVAGVFPAPSNLDALTDRELTHAVDDLIGRENSAGFHLVSRHGKLTKPAAGRALEYRATTPTTPPITIDLFVVSKGHTKVQLNCQYTAQRAKVEAACARVLASMRITSSDG